MVKEAKTRNLYIDMTQVQTHLFKPGDFFVIFDKNLGYTHIGIVLSIVVENGVATMINTVEGNTNDEGLAEGFEWCMRTRSLKKGNVAILKIK